MYSLYTAELDVCCLYCLAFYIIMARIRSFTRRDCLPNASKMHIANLLTPRCFIKKKYAKLLINDWITQFIAPIRIHTNY